MRPTREEHKRKLSERGRRGAEARWAAYHSEVEAPNYHDLPTDCFRITVENIATGQSNVLLFHPGSRRGRFRIDVNGQFWRECGWSDAMARIRKSCKRMPLYIQ